MTANRRQTLRLLAGATALWPAHALRAEATTAGTLAALPNPFSGHWGETRPAYQDPNFIIWCGSPIRGDDGRYHLFASRWPRALGMNAWVTSSEVVRADADNLLGPYQFAQVALPRRGPDHWDGMMTHNPSIHRVPGGFALYYIGVHYTEPAPTDKEPPRSLYESAWNSKRIGVAFAKTLDGPWERLDAPILEPRPDAWDAAITSNPAVVIHPDGSALLVYKSAPVPYPARNRNRALHFGAARAPSFHGPFERIGGGEPLLFNGREAAMEDPFLWHDGNRYQLIAKSMDSKLVSQHHGFHASSTDAIDWTLSEPGDAYSQQVTWTHGEQEDLPKRERPQVLLENNRPQAVFFATRRKNGDIFNSVTPVNA